MRILMFGVALVAMSACNRDGGNEAAANRAAPVSTNPSNGAAPASSNAAAVTPAPTATPSARPNASLPENFPGEGLLERGSQCIVYLGLAQEAGARPAGRDAPIMGQAQGQWEAALTHGNVPEQEWRQMVASSVNVLRSVSAAQRDAAAAWCVDNAPEVDPEH